MPTRAKSDDLPGDVTSFPSCDMRATIWLISSTLKAIAMMSFVLGIVLGGMPVAHEVARHLDAKLDLVIIRKLLQPRGPNPQG